MGGEFNMIRSTEEKSSGTINRAWTESFISFIAYDGLRELHIVGNKFTWTNKQTNPVREALDRILVSAGWENMYLLTLVRSR